MQKEQRTASNLAKAIRFGAAALIAILFSLSTTAQTLYVNQSYGGQNPLVLSYIKKLTFSDGNMMIVKSDNSYELYELAGLRYLTFTDNGLEAPIVTDVKGPLKAQELKCYPNPVVSSLNVDASGLGEGEGTLSLINLNGQTVLTQHIYNSESISLELSYLPKGVYICRYNNSNISKTVKINKQ